MFQHPIDPTQLAFGFGSAFFLLVSIVRKDSALNKGEKQRRTQLPPHCVLDPMYASSLSQDTPLEEKTSTQQILFFNQVSKNESWLVGGKGANLGELTQSDFPVPPGFCITKVAFDLHMKTKSNPSLFEQIESSAALTAEQARLLVMNSPLAEETADLVKRAYRSLCAQENVPSLLVAVRSSATAEDSGDASFAGQLETFLGVEGEEEVVKAVKACWASLYSDRVDSYRKMAGKGRGTKESSISVCVVVQRMLDADCAGVMFTANPLSQNLNETVITGNWGLGESVVADIATPDTWILRADAQNTYSVESEHVATKLKKVVLRKSGGTNNSHQHPSLSETVDIVSHEEQTQPCMSRENLQKLAQLGRRVQQHYGNHPQDTEWALLKGKLYLLQARPITTLSDEPPRTLNEFDKPCRPDDFITTCNAAEMFPGAMTPLTMSTFGRMADWSVQGMQVAFGCRSAIDKVNGIAGNYYGNFFLNMTNTLAPMCAGMIGNQMTKDNGEMSVLGRRNEKETLDHLIQIGGGSKWLPRRFVNVCKYFSTMWFAYKRIPVMQLRIEDAKAKFATLFANGSNSSAKIWDQIDRMMDEYDAQWTDGVITSSTSAFTMLFAMKLLTPFGGDIWAPQPVAEFAMLLGSHDDNATTAESAGAVEGLDKLRDVIMSMDHTIKQKFVEFAPEEAWQWMQATPMLKRDVNQLLERHGHRCVRESEMREKDWLEDPLPLIKMLQSSVRASLLRTTTTASAPAPARASAKDLLKSKKHLNFVTRRVLGVFLQLTKQNVHLRELGKSLQIKMNSLYKHAYRKLGFQLESEGRLPEQDLLYFLTHEEVGILSCVPLDHPDVHRMKTRATQRRRLYARQSQLKFPELSQGRPIPLERNATATASEGSVFAGTAVSSGCAIGPARVCKTLEEAEQLKEGEILITPQTDVGWTPYFSIASGLATEIGGMLSHGAVVAREYSLPCIVGVTNACELIETGTMVELDGDTGQLRVISSKQ